MRFSFNGRIAIYHIADGGSTPTKPLQKKEVIRWTNGFVKDAEVRDKTNP